MLIMQNFKHKDKKDLGMRILYFSTGSYSGSMLMMMLTAYKGGKCARSRAYTDSDLNAENKIKVIHSLGSDISAIF